MQAKIHKSFPLIVNLIKLFLFNEYFLSVCNGLDIIGACCIYLLYPRSFNLIYFNCLMYKTMTDKHLVGWVS